MIDIGGNHRGTFPGTGQCAGTPNSLRRSGPRFDARFVHCQRPTVITGGELTLDMLDLKYNAVARTYQAPLQLKERLINRFVYAELSA